MRGALCRQRGVLVYGCPRRGDRSVSTRPAASGSAPRGMDLERRSLSLHSSYPRGDIVALALARLDLRSIGLRRNSPRAEAPTAEPNGEDRGCKTDAEGSMSAARTWRTARRVGPLRQTLQPGKRGSQAGAVTSSPTAVSRTVTGRLGASHVNVTMQNRRDRMARSEGGRSSLAGSWTIHVASSTMH
jgi:hypothetical protein